MTPPNDDTMAKEDAVVPGCDWCWQDGCSDQNNQDCPCPHHLAKEPNRTEETNE